MILETEQREELITFFQMRGNIYTVFAKVFLGEFEDLQESLKAIGKEAEEDEFIGDIIKQLNNTPLEELRTQHEQLFAVPAAYYVPPYSGYHLPINDENLKGDYVEQIYHYYKVFNFTAPIDKFERGDHIGYLLAFSAYINEALLDLIKCQDEDNAVQSIKFLEDFLQKHINSWFGLFEKEVALKLERGLLLDAVQSLHQFIDWDLEQLAQL